MKLINLIKIENPKLIKNILMIIHMLEVLEKMN